MLHCSVSARKHVELVWRAHRGYQLFRTIQLSNHLRLREMFRGSPQRSDFGTLYWRCIMSWWASFIWHWKSWESWKCGSHLFIFFILKGSKWTQRRRWIWGHPDKVALSIYETTVQVNCEFSSVRNKTSSPHMPGTVQWYMCGVCRPIWIQTDTACAHYSGGGDLSIMQHEGECSRRSRWRRACVCVCVKCVYVSLCVCVQQGWGGVKWRRWMMATG